MVGVSAKKHGFVDQGNATTKSRKIGFGKPGLKAQGARENHVKIFISIPREVLYYCNESLSFNAVTFPQILTRSDHTFICIQL